jgi:hypothetical protein
MNGKQHFEVLRNCNSRTHLLEHAKENGISWKQADHEGVNWLRACSAIINYLNENNEFYMGDIDPESANSMIELYNQIKEYHKRTMNPHLRSAMDKIVEDSGDNITPSDELLNQAHELLDKSGGALWREKVDMLSNINRQINYLSQRMEGIQQE